ncbi:MAG: ketopantoate reductase family protein [Syntrophomonadaceae bacterium]
MQVIKTIWVVGIGGVGGYFGGWTAYALDEGNDGRRVYFIARGQHLQEIQKNGLILQCNEDTFVCKPAGSSDDMSCLPRPDLCLICVKSYDLEAAVQGLNTFIGDDTVVVPLLNGLDIYERTRKCLDKGIVLPACVYITSYIERPGKVVQNGPNKHVIVGPSPHHPDFDPAELLSFTEEMGLSFKWLDDPFAAIWQKYLLVGSFALVTAAYGMSFGEVLDHPAAKRDVSEAMREIIQLAQKQGINLGMQLIEKIIALMNGTPYQARSSFQRDLEQGRGKAEEDIFGAAVIRMGKELGIPTPVTERMVRQIEMRYGGSEKPV